MTIDNIGQFLDKNLGTVDMRSKDFNTKMTELISKDGGATPEDLIQLNFEMGQYNAMIEAISNVTKSVTDTLKSLAQKTG